MSHIVLLGDSIFDNARYVPDRPPVIEQLRRSLPRDWTATLLAVDVPEEAWKNTLLDKEVLTEIGHVFFRASSVLIPG